MDSSVLFQRFNNNTLRLFSSWAIDLYNVLCDSLLIIIIYWKSTVNMDKFGWYARLAWRRALTELRSRYTGSILGGGWNAVQPLLMIAIFSVVFSEILGARLPGIDSRMGYALFLCAGFFPWLAFSESVTMSCHALIRNSGYIKKMPVSEHVFFLETILSSMALLAISFSVFLLCSIAFGNAPSMTWFLIPLVLLPIGVFAFGVGLMAGLLNVYIRDTGVVVPVLLQLMMWMTPIIYPLEIIPKSLRFLIELNPLTPVLSMVRDVTLHASVPQNGDIMATMVWIGIISVCAWFVWRKLQSDVRDLV